MENMNIDERAIEGEADHRSYMTILYLGALSCDCLSFMCLILMQKQSKTSEIVLGGLGIMHCQGYTLSELNCTSPQLSIHRPLETFGVGNTW